MAVKGTIKTITSSGKVLTGALSRAGVPKANLGVKAPDGTIWQTPRPVLDRIKGRSVRVTNPRQTSGKAQGRTASMGMGAVGQRGRVRDVGASMDT